MLIKVQDSKFRKWLLDPVNKIFEWYLRSNYVSSIFEFNSTHVSRRTKTQYCMLSCSADPTPNFETKNPELDITNFVIFVFDKETLPN